MDLSRNGNFTSSEIVALMSNGKVKGSFGKPALTYIEECNMERRLGRSISDESNARPLVWGKLCETLVFDLLPINYKLCSQETIAHSSVSCWKGSPDMEKFDEGKTVCDIKCPHTLKSFCQLVQPFYEGLRGMDLINAIRAEHKDGEKYYWQLVSNAILTKSKHAELIVFAPFRSQLDEIRSRAQKDGNPNYYWIWSSSDDELPWLPDGGYYSNINILRFEVPVEDKIALHERVVEASKCLIDPSQISKAA
jgi:hypothetical protein